MGLHYDCRFLGRFEEGLRGLGLGFTVFRVFFFRV